VSFLREFLRARAIYVVEVGNKNRTDRQSSIVVGVDFTVFIIPIDKRWTSFKTKSKDDRRATYVIIELFNRNIVHLLYFIYLQSAIFQLST
jgi:hypothetical protein